MIFKRCTIGGCDYSHKSFSTANNTVPRVNDKASSSFINENRDIKRKLPVKNNEGVSEQCSPRSTEDTVPINNLQSGRAIIPVNPILSERLNFIDVQVFIDGGDASSKIQDQARQVQEFFLLLAVCNTVIVAKYPHHDHMNASGLICASSNTSVVGGTSGFAGGINSRSNEVKAQNRLQRRSMEINNTENNTDLDKDARMGKDEEAMHNILADDHLSSTTPPVSIKSTSTITTSLSLTPTSSLTTAPLQPEPSLTTKGDFFLYSQ